MHGNEIPISRARSNRVTLRVYLFIGCQVCSSALSRLSGGNRLKAELHTDESRVWIFPTEPTEGGTTCKVHRHMCNFRGNWLRHSGGNIWRFGAPMASFSRNTWLPQRH